MEMLHFEINIYIYILTLKRKLVKDLRTMSEKKKELLDPKLKLFIEGKKNYTLQQKRKEGKQNYKMAK